MNEDLRMRLTHTPTPEEERFFDALCIDLTREADVDYGINVFYKDIIENGEDDSAFVEFNGNEFTIYIDARLDFGSRIDMAIHEFAHIAAWEEDEHQTKVCARGVDESTYHSMYWGEQYARMYQKYLKTYKTFWKIK